MRDTKLDWEEQAAPSDPHWIVKCLSRQSEMPVERGKAFFRHRTEAAAIKEAQWRASSLPGRRFSVYGSGPSFKVELETQKDAAA